jgi:tetratricopeptide (TPR) repeat protein
VWRDTAAKAGDRPERWEPDEVWIVEPDAGAARDGWDDGVRRGRSSGSGRQAGTRGGSGAPQRVGRAAAEQPAADQAEVEAPKTRDPKAAPGHRRNVPQPVVAELASTAGSQRGAKLAGRLADATHAFERERYQEARRILRPLAEEVPDAVAVQELYGLVLYRMGQWAVAAKHLELYRARSASTDQHPVLADCYRALRRYDDAEALWDELRAASPSGDLVAEGRIVAAGCKADQGDLAGAIAILERSGKRVNRPQEYHIRQWYALADLYERAGDLPRAKELFSRIDGADPDAFDVRQRLRALR